MMMNGNPMMVNPQYPVNNFMGSNPSFPTNNFAGITPVQNEPVNNLIRVTGIDGAKAYQMQPNSTVVLFDSSEDLLYVKSTDGAGFPTIRTFSFSPIEQQEVAPTNDYISREEFEEFKKEIKQYGKQSIQQSKSKPKLTE